MPIATDLQHAAALHQRAEARAAAKEYQDPAILTPEEARRVLHELRVHQIELEMQNEELWRTQVRLEGLRARYFDLYHQAPIGYLTLGERGLILEANLRAAALLGMARGTLVGRPLGRFILAEDAEVYYRHHKQLFQTGEPQTCEVRLAPRSAGAPIVWARLEAVLAQDEEQQATVSRVILRDITERVETLAELKRHRDHLEELVQARTHALEAEIAERQRAEDALRDLNATLEQRVAERTEALRASEERYRTLLAMSPDGISVSDNTGLILACNEQGAHMHGYSHSTEMIGRHAGEFYAPEAFAALFGQAAEILRSGQDVARDIETVIRRRDGSAVEVECSIARVPWPDAPSAEAFVANFRDITRRKKMATELQRHRDNLEELVQERTRDLEAEIAQRAAAQAAL